MRLHLNNAEVKVSGTINTLYTNVTCIEDLSSKVIEMECGEKIGSCIRLHYGDGETATFPKKLKLNINMKRKCIKVFVRFLLYVYLCPRKISLFKSMRFYS